MQVYTGKPTGGGSENNQGMRVVLDVTEGLRGHTATDLGAHAFYIVVFGRKVSELPEILLLEYEHKICKLIKKSDKKDV